MGRPSLFVLLLFACLLGASSAWARTPPPTTTSSSITSPASGAELFYDGDSATGSVAIAGTVSSGWGTIGDVRCYSNNGASSLRLASRVPLSASRFAASVSLAAVAGRACRLAFVPSGQTPAGAGAAAFAGPVIAVSDRFSHSQGGSLYGYDILSGTLGFAYELGSLGECPITASFTTDPVSLSSFTLFDGNGCLPAGSGAGIRSAVQVDGFNAYPPGAIPALSATAGFGALTYTAAFDAPHDTVTVTENDPLMICNAPRAYPPSTCTGLHSSGVQVQQTTQLVPGGQVVRIVQRFASVDGRGHSVDLQFANRIQAAVSNEPPGFAFPRQGSFAVHAAPDTFTAFPAGASSIFVVGNPVQSPSVANPIGAITYSRAPTSATFTSRPNAQQATFVMHYAAAIPAGSAVVYQWAFSQSTSLRGITALEQAERARF